METITLSQLKQQMTAAGRIPINGTLELTFRCNLKCIFCYCRDIRQTRPELTTPQITSLIDDITDAGCLNLLITGGEPLMKKNFKQIYNHAKYNGLLITLYSNGTLINEKTADFIAQAPPQKVEITLYGYTAKTYEKITQNPGSHKACMKGIHLLMERKIPLVLKTTVCRINVHELTQISQFAKSHNLDYKFDALLDPKIDGDHEVCDYRLPAKDLVALDGNDPDRSENLRKLVERKKTLKDDTLIYTCGAGKNAFHIDPFGQLSMCVLTRYASYDLTKGNFKQGFYDFFSDLRKQTHEKDKIPVCTNCRFIDLCTSCPGVSYMETGSFQFPSAFHCDVAKKRAEFHNLL